VSNIKSKCLRKTILDKGCVAGGSLVTNFPDDDGTDKTLGGTRNFGEFKSRVQNYYVDSKIGTDPREACYGSKGIQFGTSWIDSNSFRVKFPKTGQAYFISKNDALLTEPTKAVGDQWRLAWVADSDRDQLLWLDSSGTQHWSHPNQAKKDEMGSLSVIELTSDGNIATLGTNSQGQSQWHNIFKTPPKGTNHPDGQHMLVGRSNGDLYIDHGDNTRTFLVGPKNANEYTTASDPAASSGSSSTMFNPSPGAGGYGSDRRLKDDIIRIGTYKGYNVYRWTWNNIAMSTYGYTGSEIGFLADEIESKYIGTDVYGYKYLKKGTPVVKYLHEVRGMM
jgi:hypothetical protein